MQAIHLALFLASAALLSAEPVRVGVILDAPRQSSPAMLAALQTEVNRTVPLPGVELIWDAPNRAAQGHTSYDRVVMVRLQGSCAASRPDVDKWEGPLGKTYVSNGEVQPFVDVDCPRILTLMTSSRGNGPRFLLTDRMVGRALGRVTAHEIYHVLTRSGEHDHHGLAQPTLTRAELCFGNTTMTENSLQRMESELGPPAPATPILETR